jgi:hypothetical protein
MVTILEKIGNVSTIFAKINEKMHFRFNTSHGVCKAGHCHYHKVLTCKEYHSVCPSSELGLPPTPHPQASVPPPPCFWGEGNTRWRERVWESPNSDEGHTLWYSLYVRTLWSLR